MTKQRRTSLTVANSFGALGYLSVLVQWLWASIVIGYPLLTEHKLNFLLPKGEAGPTPPPADYGNFTPVLTGIAIAFTLLIIALTIYALIRLPATVGKRGGAIVHKTADSVTPLVMPKKATKSAQQTLTYQITWGIKLGLIILPVLAMLFAPDNHELQRAIILTVGIFCAICSILYFGVQWLMSRTFQLEKKAVW